MNTVKWFRQAGSFRSGSFTGLERIKQKLT